MTTPGRVEAIGAGEKPQYSSNVNKMKKKFSFTEEFQKALGYNVPVLPENVNIGNLLGKGGGETSGLARG